MKKCLIGNLFTKISVDVCRLSLHTERTIDEQIESLSEEHMKAFRALKEKWERKPRKMAYEGISTLIIQKNNRSI